MPVYSEFQSEGDAGQAFNQGQNAGMSMMERAQQMEQRGAQEERQKAIFQAAMPVIQAKNQADLATAHATINHVVQTQNLMTKAAQVSDTANTEFQDAQQLSDWTAKADALGALQAKYAWMGQLPTYKPFVDAINNARVEAHQSAMADMKLTGDLEIAKANNSTKQYIADQRAQGAADVANIRAAASTLNANARVNAPTDLVKNLTSVRSMILNGDDSGAEAMMGMMQAKAGVTPVHIADSLTKLADGEDKSAAVAKATGNDENFQKFSTNAQLLRTQAEGMLKKAATPTTPTAAPVSSATTSTPKNVTPEEYAKIPSGSKYWWNGQEITKK